MRRDEIDWHAIADDLDPSRSMRDYIKFANQHFSPEIASAMIEAFERRLVCGDNE